MILLFSGPAAVGKSTICRMLEAKHSFIPIKSSSYLKEIANSTSRTITREVLQEIGDRLDLETDYSWLINSVAKQQMAALKNHRTWYVDSVRKPKQVQLFRREYSTDIVHIHITASEAVLRMRFETRHRDDPTSDYEKDYDQHILHPNEISSRKLVKIADLVVDYSDTAPEQSCEQILEYANSL